MTKRKVLFVLWALAIGTVCPAFAYNDETPQTKYDYAVMVGSTKLGIGDEVTGQQLSNLLGKPILEKAEAAEANTAFSGLTMVTNTYDGLTIELYKAHDEDYYITNMTVTNGNYPTALGIKVGDPIEKLIEVYPVEQTTLSADLSQGVFDYSEGKVGGNAMEFEVSGDKIIKFIFSETWD